MKVFFEKGLYIDFLYFIGFFLVLRVFFFLRYKKSKLNKRFLKAKLLKEMGLTNIFLVFSILGLAIGILSGLSRLAVIDIVITSVFSLIAAYSVYLFSSREAKSKNAVLVIIVTISISILIGNNTGSYHRMQSEKYDKEWELISYQTKAEIDLNKALLLK
jgi:hypothetical protein